MTNECDEGAIEWNVQLELVKFVWHFGRWDLGWDVWVVAPHQSAVNGQLSVASWSHDGWLDCAA